MDRSRIDAARNSVSLHDLARKTVRLKRDARGWVGLCPLHREKTPSFHVYDDSKFKCFGCGAWGDAIDFVMLLRGVSFQDAITELSGGEAAPNKDQIMRTVEESEARKADEVRRIAHAHGLWLKGMPVQGTVAETYLRETRAIPTIIPAILKHAMAYCSVLEEETDALIAPLQDRHGHVTAVQQIFLSRETGDAWRDKAGKRVKRTLGAMRDGCVRLGLPDTSLGLAGSVEDALAASNLFSLPVWATCGEQRMSRVWVPDEVEKIVIFADADEPGMVAALEAQRVHRANGKDVTVVMPNEGKDFCDKIERTI